MCGDAKSALLTPGILINDEVDPEICQVVGKVILDWCWDRSEDERKLGAMEY